MAGDPYALAHKVAESLAVTDASKRASLENALTISLARDPALSQALEESVRTPSLAPGPAAQALQREKTRLLRLKQEYFELCARFKSLAASLERHPATLQWACPILDFARLTLPGGAPLALGGGAAAPLPRVATYRHEQVTLRYLALPVLPQYASKALLRVRREAMPSCHLAHPSLVRTHGVAQDGATVALVQTRTLCSLAALLEEARSAEGGAAAALPPAWRTSFVLDAARGLAHLHEKGFCHGHLSTATTFLAAQGPWALLADFALDSFAVGGGGGGSSGSASSGGAAGDASPLSPGALSLPSPMLRGADGGAEDATSIAGPSSPGGSLGTISLFRALHEVGAGPSPALPPPSPRQRSTAQGDLEDLWSMGCAVFEGGGGGAFPALSALPELSARALVAVLEALLSQQQAAEAAAAPAPAPATSASAEEPHAAAGGLLLTPFLAAHYPALPRATLQGSAPAAPPEAAPPHLADFCPASAIGLVECAVCAERSVLGLALACEEGEGEEGSGVLCTCRPACFPCLLRDIREQLRPGKDVPLPKCPARHATLKPAIVWQVAMWSKQGGSVRGLDRALSDSALALYARKLEEREVLVAARGQRPGAAAAAGGGVASGAGASADAGAGAEEGGLTALGVKHCPGCGVPALHYRGHHCHHIEPGKAPAPGGCSQCKTHWCYSCGHNFGKVGPTEVQWCPNHCEIFCWPSTAGELPPLGLPGACPCVDCPECKPGAPCWQCSNDGRCWVCHPENRLTPEAAARPNVLDMRNHSGHWREVTTKRAFAGPRSAPVDIRTYCDRGNEGGGGLGHCAHPDIGRAAYTRNHWSCCGKKERDAVCEPPAPFAFVQGEHVGEWRRVSEQRLYPSGAAISEFCRHRQNAGEGNDPAALPTAEGLTCLHDHGPHAPVIRRDHFSCCGATEMGGPCAAVFRRGTHKGDFRRVSTSQRFSGSTGAFVGRVKQYCASSRSPPEEGMVCTHGGVSRNLRRNRE